ncbi:DEAD/DEAH box helicase [uncultured Thiodictyon sp.]|uniref:DEAD/DEAH box helicase n=1 Tax=uncultured Thiodictyon sp. TaxID=1846217 RepID=UPI0025E218D1|nr:DEAD/DEAH box helicase [uncultured Thiodictyon sp.]
MPRPLTRDDIRHAIDLSSFNRGLGYFRQGMVIDLAEERRDSDGISLQTRVRGSGGRVYRQSIFIPADPDRRDITGSCGCPVGYNCKHVAAACLAFEERERQFQPTDGSAATDFLKRWLTRVVAAGQTPATLADADRLIYVLLPSPTDTQGIVVELRVAKPLRRGGLSKGRLANLYNLLHGFSTPDYLVAVDHDILGILRAAAAGQWITSVPLAGLNGQLALLRMVETGRCHWQASEAPPLGLGAPRDLHIVWREGADGLLSLVLAVTPAARLLLLDPPLYLDGTEHLVGAVQTQGLGVAQLRELLAAPRLRATQAEAIARTLVLEFPQLPLPPPVPVTVAEVAAAPAVPWLTLICEPLADTDTDLLSLDFDYAGHRVPGLPAVSHSVLAAGGATVRIHRDPAAEQAALDTLEGLGFVPAEPGRPQPGGHRLLPAAANPIERAGHWSALLRDGLPALEAAGWRVDIAPSFRLRFETADWDLEVDDDTPAGGNDWFGLRFDLDLGGRRVPLLPIIAPLLELGIDAELPQIISLPLDPTGTDPTAAHRYVDLPATRLLPFIAILRELFDRTLTGADGQLRISRFDAAALAELEAQGYAIRGAERLRELARRLKDFTGIESVAPPAGLTVELRPYQRRGLDWLQFLRAWDLAGILADDMGLGKTIQALAHLLLEKEAGRLDRPALVVAPTSLMGNWRREAARFTPGLRTLVLHGSDRHGSFERIPDYDLVLTTYPLLSRDQEHLQEQSFHSLILDEAQSVKNPKSQAAVVVRALQADHRLCLTGTPMENHLGELWTQFDFLLPGFLGDQASFKRHWRTPIEQHRDQERHARLARRVAPFMLRRRKQDVATELPPKTEIVKSVTLGEAQAALYEGIRLSMEKRVRDAIAAQGLARSHITILDALLKLRQTCCDPRLLKLPAAARVKESAKLELLMDLVPEQLEEGRRILLFSQFTSMLALIETELDDRGIPYAKLTGQTRKRDEAIDAFRSGAVSLFLISLKAGGVGLNLTEADTVILYDPWWNPAVESQAADRAHRIGQDKPVFVYKLVTEQTVEERILTMQERKRALAAGVYQESSGEPDLGFNGADLQALFAPLGTTD